MEAKPSQSDEVFTRLKEDPLNNKCIECRMEEPQWASVTYGIFLCKQCADIHRTMGTHISFIRSLQHDTWSPTLLSMMCVGGNKKFVDFISIYGLSADDIHEKYPTVAADFYKRQLRAIANNEEFDENAPRISEGCLYKNFTQEELESAQLVGKFGEESKGEKIKAAFKNFGTKVKKSAKEFSEKPKVKEITEKTQGFFGKIEGKMKAMVQKTKESETYQKVKEKSKSAMKTVAVSAMKAMVKLNSKEEGHENKT